jgi:hypothetical protein
MEKNLEWVARALAQTASEQKKLYPDYVLVPDELAMDWEYAFDRADFSSMNEKQWQSIKILHDYLLSKSGPLNARVWENESLHTAVEWQHIRRLARAVLQAMNWSPTNPGKNGDTIYVVRPD